jgi:Ca2+-binding RTX toxin-like protein
MVGRRRGLGVLVVAGVLFLGLTVISNAQARTSCSYAGPPENVLSVRVTGDGLAVIERSGDEILVGERRPRRCTGGVPSVLNTDVIRVRMRGLFAFADLSLGGGPFAPGATPEPEGASEIEVEFGGAEPFSSVVGTSGPDEFHWGREGSLLGLNLNPGTANDQDVDVTMAVGGFFGGVLIADGADGNDRIVPAPNARLPGEADSEGGRGNDLLIAPRSGGELDGEEGNDVLLGGSFFDALDGGAGSDRLRGRGRADVIRGGLGRDLLSGGRGGDFLRDRDGRRDVLRCGPGQDRVKADRRDRLRGCERVSRAEPR